MIASQAPLPTLPALSYGPEASGLVAEHGLVRAIVSMAIYLETARGRIVSLADASMPEGPLMLSVQGLGGVIPPLSASAGELFHAGGSTLQIAGKLRIDLSGARPWAPPVVRVSGTETQVSEAARSLAGAIGRHGASTGLGRLAFSVNSLLGMEGDWRARAAVLSPDPLLRASARALHALGHAWQEGDEGALSGAAVRLLGLGPGLTPSGDDLLCGLLAVCKWAERRNPSAARFGAALARTIHSEGAARTTRLSVRLLEHAANGLLYEPAMSVGAALFSGDGAQIEQYAARLFKIGHSSGTDLAVGILIGAMLYNGPANRPEALTGSYTA
jgi:hypothetical protein